MNEPTVLVNLSDYEQLVIDKDRTARLYDYFDSLVTEESEGKAAKGYYSEDDCHNIEVDIRIIDLILGSQMTEMGRKIFREKREELTNDRSGEEQPVGTVRIIPM